MFDRNFVKQVFLREREREREMCVCCVMEYSKRERESYGAKHGAL